MKDDCLFCQIIRGELSSYKIYEDGDVLVILDKFPKIAGECLVLTKKHYENLFDLDPAVEPKIFDAAVKTAKKIRSALSAEGVNLLQNNGDAAGQLINHFHMHIIPRYKTDNMKIEGKTLELEETAFEKLTAQISGATI
jgi:histidine triad (HIT) family protein